jgi:speckle-type POZ protein
MGIKEVSSEVFSLVLSFLYTNETPFEGHEDVIVDLLLAAGRFLVQELKQRIEKLLVEQLDAENALDLLLISETAQTPKLRNACIDLISLNLPEFQATEGYKILSRLHPNTKRHVDFLYCSQQKQEVEEKMSALAVNCS